eukprot:PITA_04586
MPNDKAPGPDGFTINFYKACWSIVKQEVWEVVEDSRRSGTILKSLNSTFLALIPKVEEAKTPDKFRPIVLCNILHPCQRCSIYPFHSLEGDKTKGSLIPFSLRNPDGRPQSNHSQEESGRDNKRSTAYKITSCHYSSTICRRHNVTWISHCEGGVAYRAILDLFSKASGMEINFSKSTIFFFNTHPAVQTHLSQLLGFRIGSLPSRYLGAPLTLKPWQKGHWEKVLANLKKRCLHWTNRALNLASRLILTKAVLQAIPQYLLFMLPAPKGILQQMRNIQ